MPAKKVYKRRYPRRKRLYKKKSKTLALINKNGIAKLPLSTPSQFTDFKPMINLGCALPRKIKGSLTTSDFVTYTLSTTVNQMAYIMLNSLNDPFSTTSSRQAFAYDKLSPLYRAYYVYGATITIKARTTSDTSPIQFAYGITGVDYYLSTSDIQGVPMGDTTMITKNQSYNIRFYVDLYRAAGLKRQNDDQGNPFVATVGSDPGVKVWLCVSQENIVSSTQTLIVNYQIEQHYVMFDPKLADMVD